MEIKIVVDERLVAAARSLKGWRGLLLALGVMLLPLGVYATQARYVFSDGQVIYATQLNANFQDLHDRVDTVANDCALASNPNAWQCTEASGSGTATCPGGYKLITGGCKNVASSSAGVGISSYPSGNTWRCNTSTGAAASAVAMCCR